MDYELLEQWLDNLATPLAQYQSARVRVVKRLESPNMRGMGAAIKDLDVPLTKIHELIMGYAELVNLSDPNKFELDGKAARVAATLSNQALEGQP